MIYSRYKLYVYNIVVFRVQTRPNWKKERATNQETFGSFAVRTLNNRRGGFRRGNGQRGFGRF